VKCLTPKGRKGNAGTRIAETSSGVLNCIGLENPGAEHFVSDILPGLTKYDVPLLANMSAGSVEEFAWMAETLSVEGISGLEVNVSCPNVKNEGLAFGVDPHVVEEVTKAVRAKTKLPIIIKLSPNVTDIAEIARACEAGGANGVSLINTLLGMAIDARTRRPILGNIYGGLSGPAVKPVALRMVHQVSKAVTIPIIGLGGIMTGTDAAEFMLAGASAVQVGTATMVDPRSIGRIARELDAYCESQGIQNVSELTGALTI
ncbi:MAG: dihydroorotate dehydrogenase, partial [Limosilactobacillus mucosae]|nr:dihydroorotate dehydrogenase [Limosilactobacillus mucosae]